MKIVLLFAALILAVAKVKSDLPEEHKKIDAACREESQANEADIKEFFHGDKKKEPSDNVKCHLKCVMDKQGYWKNGALDVETAKKHLENDPHLKDHKDEINKMVDECKDKKGANECDTAYLITKCGIEHYHAVM